MVENGRIHTRAVGEIRMTVPRHGNERAARKLAHNLRASDRLDDTSDAVMTLAVGLAAATDAAIAGETPGYNLERIANSYRNTLQLLSQLVTPATPDSFAEFLREVSTPSPGNGAARWSGPFGDG
jgi:hypothetical protein